MLSLEFDGACLSAKRENAVTVWFAAAMQVDRVGDCLKTHRAEIPADVRDCPPKFFMFFSWKRGHLFQVFEKMVGAARIELATPPV
jgi:hypothetical protein